MIPNTPEPIDCLPELTADKLLNLLRHEAFVHGAAAMRTLVINHLQEGARFDLAMDIQNLWPANWGLDPGITIELATDPASDVFEYTPELKQGFPTGQTHDSPGSCL